jgi:hypothetical protein
MERDMGNDHLSEEDLILHYYGEMPPAEETAAAAHLDSCKRCRVDYTRLQRVLGSVDEVVLTPADLPSSFERTVWARLEPNLRKHRRGWISWLGLAPAPLALAATVILLVAGAFFAGRTLSPPVPVASVAPGAAPTATEQIRERILLSSLGQHLDRSQMVLVELVNSPDEGNVNFSGERTRAAELVADSRLYRQTAEETGDTAVSELLDEIERVLTEIAAGPDQMSSQDLADLRRRIESLDLLFKVRVASSEVRERQKEALQRSQKEALQRKTGQRS